MSDYVRNSDGWRVTVTSDDGQHVKFHQAGGGFEQRLPCADFFAKYGPAPAPVWRRAVVTAEFLEGVHLRCWSDGSRWNGWGMPAFEKAGADKLVDLQVGPLAWRGAAVVGTDPEEDVWKPRQLGDVTVWDIGAGSWCWDLPVIIPTHDELVARMKAEVDKLIEQGDVPKDVASFGDLHDHIDANTLGGLCEDELFDALWAHFGGTVGEGDMPEAMCDFMNKAQAAVSDWLHARAGAPVKTDDDCGIYAMGRRERDTVLAALRYYQTAFATCDAPPATVRDIATNGGEHTALDADEIDQLVEDLNHLGLTFGDIINVIGKDDSDPYVAAAREHHLLEEGTLEVDLPAVVSESTDGGAYVMAWLWVDNPKEEENHNV